MVAVESAPPSGGEDKSFGCVRLRGLPFTSTYQDILQFFEAYTVVDVLITKTGGKPNGQGYVLLSSQAESQQACVELNNKFMGKRYIEVFSSTVADMETARRMSEDRPKASTPRQQDLLFPMASQQQQQQQQPGGHLAQHSSAMCQLPGLLEPLMQLSLADHSRSSAFTNSNSSNSNIYITSGNAASANQQLQFNLQQLTQQQQQQQTQLVHIIRLRGLPFSSTEADVAAFLAPIELPGGGSAIRLARHPDLRPTGEAYVTLRTEAEVMAALKKHKSMMGKRYIEVFPSCFAEMQQGLHQQLAPPPPPVGGPLIFTPPSMSSAGAMSAANYMKSLLPNNSPLLAPMGPPPACNLQQQLTQQQLLLAALQQQQQQQGLAIRAQAATLTQNYIPGSMQQMQMQGVQMQGMPGAGSGLACFTPNPNPGMASLLAQQQQQAVTAALAATVLPSMPLVPAASACGVSSGSFAGLGDSLSMAQLDTSAALAASIAASTSGMASSDMHYVPYYSNSVVASVAQQQQQQQQQLLQSASMAQLMSPTCSTGGSFAQIVSSAGLDMLSSSSGCLDSSTTGVMPVAAAAAAAAAAAVCNEPLPLDGCGGARQGGSAGVFL